MLICGEREMKNEAIFTEKILEDGLLHSVFHTFWRLLPVRKRTAGIL